MKKLYQLPHFSGNPTPGVRAETAGLDEPATDDIVEPEIQATAEDEEEEEEEDCIGDDDEDEDVQDEITGLTDFVGSLRI